MSSRCRAVSRGGCRGVEFGTLTRTSMATPRWCRDGVEGCRGVSRVSSWQGVSRCRVGVEVLVSRCRGQGSASSPAPSPREIHYIAPPRELSCELCVCCASSSPDPVLQPVTARLARVGSRPPEPNRNRVQRVCACGPVLGATRWERLMTDLKSSHNGIRKRI